MSFAAEVEAGFSRIGQEIKTLRAEQGGAESDWELGPFATQNARYKTKATNAKNEKLKFGLLADSTGDGYTGGLSGGSTKWGNVWSQRLIKTLRSQQSLPVGGEGWIPPKVPLYPGGYNYATATYLPEENAGTFDELSSSVGIPGSLWLQRGHATNIYEVTYSLTPGTTSVDILFTGYGGNLEANGAAFPSSGDRQVLRINTPGATLNLKGEPGNGFALFGIYEYVGDETVGIEMMNLSQGAIRADEVHGRMLDGAGSLKPVLQAYSPDVLLILLGSNDLDFGRSPSDTLTSLLGIASEAKSVVPDVEVVYLIRPNSDPQWGALSTLLINGAGSVGASCFDMRTILPPLTDTTAWLSDEVHLTAQGEALFAQKVADFFAVENSSGGLSVQEVQSLIDAALLAKPRFWSSEVIINSSGLADGYNDNVGGVLVDNDILLYQASFRIADPIALIGGTGNLQIQWYAGSSTALESELITTTQIAAGEHDVIVTFATPMPYTINTVLRAKITRGSTTVNGPCHIQWRGRYR